MIAIVLISMACGALAARPVVARARHVGATRRYRALAATPMRSVTSAPAARARGLVEVPILRVFAAIPRYGPARAERDAVVRAVPVALDLLAVAVRSGATPYTAVDLVAPWAPSAVAPVLREVLHSCSLGSTFAEALEHVVRADDSLQPLVAALRTSEEFGAPIGDRLSERAADARSAWRRHAEAHARRVPVRLLFPLGFLVLPAFAGLTVVPQLLAGFGST